MDLTDATVAVVGATGAVGIEILDVLAGKDVPIDRIRALSSPRSAGRAIPVGDNSITAVEVGVDAFDGCDVVLFATSPRAVRQWVPVAHRAGADVIDNSPAFRMDPGVPLVIPEVNAHTLPESSARPRLIANPNCTTILMLVALNPIYKRFGCRRLVVSTYQALSGAGSAAIDEFMDQSRAVLSGEQPVPSVFPEVCAFNIFSHESGVNPETGLNEEEEKLIHETRKIWADESIQISATCVRVPVLRVHTESINIALATPATEAEIRETLAGAAGVEVVDDRIANRFPTPRGTSGCDLVRVGRIRPDPGASISSDGRTDRFDLICCGDHLRKGAALNAVQIAEALKA